MQYQIETTEKKNVYIRTECTMPGDGPAADKKFFTEEWYRWGSCVVEAEERPCASEDPYTTPLRLDEYEIVDQNSDDGCTLDFIYGDDWTAEEKAYVEELWDNGGFYDIVYIGDVETVYYGPIEVTEV